MIDVRSYGAVANGTFDCVNAINSALLIGDVIIKNGIFAISDSISIPSNRTVNIKNAEIKLLDSSYKSIFINSDFQNGNENIHIIGDGFSVLNSNALNNYDNDFELMPLFSESAYNHIQTVFCNVDNFTISGIVVGDRTKMFIQLQKCTNGTITNLWIDYIITQRNLGGIIIRHLCNNITISNIRGRTGDDFMSVNCGSRDGTMVQIQEYTVGDTHDITISDINTGYSGYRSIIILNGEGNKIYNIDVSDWLTVGSAMWCWFGPSGYTENPPDVDDTYDITMDSIIVEHLSGSTPVFTFTDSCKDITVTNLTNNSGNDLYVDDGGIQENIFINGEQI